MYNEKNKDLNTKDTEAKELTEIHGEKTKNFSRITLSFSYLC